MVTAEYKTSVAIANDQPVASDSRAELTRLLEQAMRERQSEEIQRGISLVGPHRDDVVVFHGAELPAKGYASHGECWSLALATARSRSFQLLRRRPR